jgi:hypothetical protein
VTLTGAVAGRTRALFVWLGVVFLTLVALDALARLGLGLRRIVAMLPQTDVTLGLIGLGIAAAAAFVLLAAAWQLAARGPHATRLALLGGLILLALVRLAIAVALDSPSRGEMLAFDNLARGMLSGECCFDDRATGYPMLLVGAYALLGAGPTATEMLNLVLGIASGVVLYLLVAQHAGARAGILALYLLALWPAGALLSNARLSETLYILILLLAALAATHRASWRLAALSGVALGAAQYVRPTTLALVPTFMLVQALPWVSWRAAVLRTAVPLLAALLLLLTPVVAYNLQVHGDLSLSTSAYGGWSLYIGTDQEHGGRWSGEARDEMQALTPGGTWEDSKVAGQLALERILRDPVGFTLLAARKFDTVWGSEDFGVVYAMARAPRDQPERTFPTLASNAFYAALVAAAALALFRRRHEIDTLTVLVVGLSLTVAVVHVFVEARDRYHAYVTPFLMALVAAEASRWLSSRAQRAGPGA